LSNNQRIMADPWEKSGTVDPEVRAYVSSLVNAVGGSSAYDDTYAVGDDALAALGDITRWLKLVSLPQSESLDMEY
jgi:replication fork protection complex subunit Tof1/Swi1